MSYEELFGEMEEEGDEEPSDAISLGSRDTDSEEDVSDKEVHWKRMCVPSLCMLSHASLPKCKRVPLQVVKIRTYANGRLHICLYEAREAKGLKSSMLGVETWYFVKKLFSTYISTNLRVERARAIAPQEKGTGAKRRDDPTGGGQKGADRGTAGAGTTPETHPIVSPEKVGIPNDSLGVVTHMMWAIHKLTPPIVWFR